MTITLLAPDGLAVTAQQERQAKAAQHGGGSGRQLGGRSGFRVGTPSNVLTATSTTWTLGPCAAEIDPGASLHQGMYGWASDANVTGTVTAADATYDRKDIVYIQVNDPTAGDGTGSLGYAPQYLAGTASATPAAPTLPARSFLVGTITVPKAGGGSPTVVRNPAVYVAAGAPLPVSSVEERDAIPGKFDGLIVQRRELPGRPLETYDGSAWNRLSPVFAKALGEGVLNSIPAVNPNLGPVYVPFPSGRFSVPPIVTITSDQSRVIVVAADVSTAGFNLYATNVTTSDSGAGVFRWSAEQMTAASATG